MLEVIVTLVIVSMLVTILMQALSHALSLRARLLTFQGEVRVAVLQEAWFRDAIGGAQNDLEEGYGVLTGTDDTLEYVTPAPLVAKGLSQVRWWIESGREGQSLHYADAATEDMIVVPGPLRNAAFAYLDHDGNWQRDWDGNAGNAGYGASRLTGEDAMAMGYTGDLATSLPQLVRFEATTSRGNLHWLVPVQTDPRPPLSLRLMVD